MSDKKQLFGLIVWLALAFAAAAVGAFASVNASSFYFQLNQPEWAPPAFVFGPVWTVLYAMMGISAWLVWRSGGFKEHGVALTLFLVQLVVNGTWSWLFFGFRLGALAFVDILLLWFLIAGVLYLFWRASLVAGVLLIPYLFWVTFAAYLNFTIWQLNPEVLG